MLSAGHIDSARYYENEDQVIAAASAFQRENPSATGLFLTTKIKSEEHAKREEAVAQSIARASAAGLKWDCFILHDPIAGKQARLDIYRTLLEAQKRGEIRSAAVSNFTAAHLEEIAAAGLPLPDVNQIELHPWAQQKPIVDYCEAHGVVVQAYCPLVRGAKMDDETLVAIVAETGKTGAQVLLRWHLQRGFVPLPKSDTLSRIKENADLYDFELSAEQMARLDALDQGDAGITSWNPAAIKENAAGSWMV